MSRLIIPGSRALSEQLCHKGSWQWSNTFNWWDTGQSHLTVVYGAFHGETMMNTTWNDWARGDFTSNPKVDWYPSDSAYTEFSLERTGTGSPGTYSSSLIWRDEIGGASYPSPPFPFLNFVTGGELLISSPLAQPNTYRPDPTWIARRGIWQIDVELTLGAVFYPNATSFRIYARSYRDQGTGGGTVVAKRYQLIANEAIAGGGVTAATYSYTTTLRHAPFWDFYVFVPQVNVAVIDPLTGPIGSMAINCHRIDV